MASLSPTIAPSTTFQYGSPTTFQPDKSVPLKIAGRSVVGGTSAAAVAVEIGEPQGMNLAEGHAMRVIGRRCPHDLVMIAGNSRGKQIVGRMLTRYFEPKDAAR